MPPKAAWIDATMEFGAPAGTWPGDALFEVEWTGRLTDRKWGVNLSRFSSSPHNGTHADAPFHVDDVAPKSEAFPLDAFIGPCIVVDATKEKDLAPARMAAGILATRPERVLFKTRNGLVPKSFPKGFIGLEPALAEKLVVGGVRLIGTDAPSVDRADLSGGLRSHVAIFKGGGFNLENLDLARVEPGAYDLVALPLKVAGLCAAPVRAILRPR